MVNRISNRWICNCGANDISVSLINNVKVTCKKCGDSFATIDEHPISKNQLLFSLNADIEENYNTEYINNR